MSEPVKMSEAERRELSEAAKQRLLTAYQATWATGYGRDVLEDLLEFSGINRDGISAAESPALGTIDPLKLASFAGSRRVGLRIASFLDMAAHEMAARHAKPKTPPQTQART